MSGLRNPLVQQSTSSAADTLSTMHHAIARIDIPLGVIAPLCFASATAAVISSAWVVTPVTMLTSVMAVISISVAVMVMMTMAMSIVIWMRLGLGFGFCPCLGLGIGIALALPLVVAFRHIGRNDVQHLLQSPCAVNDERPAVHHRATVDSPGVLLLVSHLSRCMSLGNCLRPLGQVGELCY